MYQSLVGGGDKTNITAELCEMIGASPEVLIVPTAARTEAIQASNVDKLTRLMGSLGITTSAITELHAFDTNPSEEQSIDAFSKANLIYVCGGNYGVLTRFLDRNPVIKDQLTALPQRNNVALYGASSGAIIQCALGQSQPVGNDIQHETDWQFELVEGLAIGAAADYAVCVHANKAEPHPNGPKLREEYFATQVIPASLTKLLLPNGVSYITPHADSLPEGKFIRSEQAVAEGLTGTLL